MTDVEYAMQHGAHGLPPRLTLAIGACHGLGRPELERTVFVEPATGRLRLRHRPDYSVETPEALRGKFWNGREWVSEQASKQGDM